MFYGVEQSTDMREPRTVIKKFSSKVKLLKWMETSGGFTYDDPVGARNHHHTFRHGYEYQGRVDTKDKSFKDYGTSCYPRNSEDNLASFLYKYGTEIHQNQP
jgi:hypothetical protein